MKKANRFVRTAAATALTLTSLGATAQSWSLNFFPELPVYRSILTNSDILRTQINLPSGLEKELIEKPIKELVPYVSLAKEVPIVSFNIKSKRLPSFIPIEVAVDAGRTALKQGKNLSDDILSAYLVAGAGLTFPKNENPSYTAKAELFLNSPLIDDYMSDGNKFIFVAGVKGKGKLNPEKILDSKIKTLSDSLVLKSYGFSGDFYIVAKSPYSKQYLVLRAGLDNLFNSNSEKPNFNLSGAFEIPSLTYWIKPLKNFKLLPYVSFGIKAPFDGSTEETSGEIGLKLTGESEKSAMMYIRGQLDSLGGQYSTGLKFEL